MESILKYGWIPSETLLEKTRFSYAGSSFSTEDSFWVRAGGCVHFASQFWNLIWHRLMQVLCILPISMGLCVLVLLCLEGLVFFVSSIPLAFTIFLSPLLHSFLIPEGMDLIETSHLGLSVTHIVLLWIFVFVPIYCRSKLL